MDRRGLKEAVVGRRWDTVKRNEETHQMVIWS